MSTPSRCGATRKTAQVITGALLVVGVAALAWALFVRKDGDILDPLEEADRRINELEESLHRLQDTFVHAIIS